MSKPTKYGLLLKRVLELDILVANLADELSDTLKQLDQKARENMPTDAQQKRIDSQKFSWGIVFVRAKRISKIKAVGGWESKPGATRTSDRRFGTRDEALIHAKRFTKIEGHKSYSVHRVAKRVNAWVNLATGKTNPVIGLGRKNRD